MKLFENNLLLKPPQPVTGLFFGIKLMTPLSTDACVPESLH